MKAYILFTLATFTVLTLLGSLGVVCSSQAVHAVSGEAVLNLKPLITSTVAFIVLQVVYFTSLRKI